MRTNLKPMDKSINDFNSNTPLDYLPEDMQDSLDLILEEEYGITKHDFKLSYDLSYSQWSWVCFSEWTMFEEQANKLLKINNLKDCEFSIKRIWSYNLYAHKKTFEVDITDYDDGDFNDLEMQWYAEDLTNVLRDITDKLMTYWYNRIEEQDRESQASALYMIWTRSNNIETDYNLYDLTRRHEEPTKWERLKIWKDLWINLEHLALAKHVRRQVTYIDWEPTDDFTTVFYKLT